MDPINGITQGLTRSLAISEAEADKVVGLDDLDGLTSRPIGELLLYSTHAGRIQRYVWPRQGL